MDSLTTTQRTSILKYLEITNEQVIFASAIDKFNKYHEKIENRVLVITPYRIITFKHGLFNSLKVARFGLILHLQNLTYEDDFKIRFEMPGWVIGFTLSEHMTCVRSILACYNECSIMIPVENRCTFNINTSAQDILNILTNKRRPIFDDHEWNNYIFGMLTIYRCMCTDLSICADQTVETELRNIYERAMTEFKLDGITKSIKIEQYCALIKTLEYDDWFHEIFIDNIPGGDLIFESVSNIILKSKIISKIVLRNCNANSKSIQYFCNALNSNPMNPLIYLDLSNNNFNISILETLIPSLPALHYLILRNCHMNVNCTVRLFQLFNASPLLSKSLVKLDVSENILNVDGSEAIANWLITRTPSQLRQLDLSKCQLYFCPLVKALSMEEMHVNSLDISGNLIDEEEFLSLNPFIAMGKIQYIGLGDMKNRLQYVEGVLASVLLNNSINECSICLNNNIYPNDLYQRIVSLLSVSMNLKELYLRNCDLKNSGVNMLCESLLKSNHNQISVLSLDNNIKAQDIGKASETLCCLIESSPCLVSLSLKGNKGLSMTRLVQAITNPDCKLTYLNISDCEFRDDDFTILYNALLKNKTTLKSLIWDNNLVSVISYKHMLEIVKLNSSLIDMGYLLIHKETEKSLLSSDITTIKNYKTELFAALWANQCYTPTDTYE